ncbi:transglutaminase-like domain-containing protein [Paenibacillus sp. M1]|uniref:Transglutaminase-like domain-containing protein n=1 Tax=Paenibacillus haidiansis TaxID=1574488 RepID=A0ABU7VQR8_9BACL
MTSLNHQSPVTGGPLPGVHGLTPLTPEADKSRRLAEGGRRALTSLLLLGLFGEWLYPLYSFLGGEPVRLIGLFLALTGILLLLGCFRLPAYAFVPLPPLLIAGAMYFLFGQAQGFSWFSDCAGLIAADVAEAVQTGRLYGLGGETRTLLLLIGWSLLVVSVQALALSKQSNLLFFAASVLYLLALETVGDVPVYAGLVRTAGWGLALQALVFRSRLRAGGKPGGAAAIAIAIAACVAGPFLLSSLLPVQPARAIAWSQVAQVLEGWSGSGLNGPSVSYALSGYGKDDTRLGAPLRLRHETYFTAVSPENTYWRGESKSVYTGAGWASSPADPASASLAEPERPEVQSAARSVRQTVIFKEPATGTVPLFSGGSPLNVERVFAGKPTAGGWEAAGSDSGALNAGTGSPQANSRYDAGADAFYFAPAYPEQAVYGYELEAGVPEVSAERLRAAGGEDPAELAGRELQLPDSLPERVRRLGADLVEERPSRYDAVLAVMNYLKKHYAYSLDSQYPPAGSDFADYFLFEQKIGYCDHFSTAMTVLLRSGGIPARWVKGFAPGTPVSEDEHRYTVSYADAHSWVEVYFPGAGWIPFDPTPGYESAFAAASTDGGGQGLLEQGSSLWRRLSGSLGELMEETAAKLSNSLSLIQERLFFWTSLLSGFGLTVLFAVLYRKYWLRQSRYLLWLFMLGQRRRFPERRELLRAAECVWRELYNAYGAKTPEMTAREYVEFISTKNGGRNSDDLESFVRIWENLYYGGAGLDRTDSRGFLKMCRNLAYSGR